MHCMLSGHTRPLSVVARLTFEQATAVFVQQRTQESHARECILWSTRAWGGLWVFSLSQCRFVGFRRDVLVLV